MLTPLATWCEMGQHWRGVMRLTTCGAWTAFTLLLLAFAILVSCFLTSDFRSFMLRSIAIVSCHGD